MDKINIGGKERAVKYNFNAYEELQEMGFDILTNLSELTKNLKFVRALVYVGLKYGEDETGEKEPELSLKKVGAILKNEHLSQFIKILNKGDKDDPPETQGELPGATSNAQPSEN